MISYDIILIIYFKLVNMFDKSELRLEENVFVKSVIGHLSMLAEVGEVVELSENMPAQMAATVLS